MLSIGVRGIVGRFAGDGFGEVRLGFGLVDFVNGDGTVGQQRDDSPLDLHKAAVVEVALAPLLAVEVEFTNAESAYGKLSDSARKNRDTAKKLAEIATFHAGILKLCDEVDADARKTAREIKQALSSAYAASRQAASTQNILTEELDQPGHGAFSD